MQYCDHCGARLESHRHGETVRAYCPRCRAWKYRNPMAAVAGIILQEQRLLLVRRAPGQTYAGKWCIPCGHIEWGEDIRDALVREMQEETGLTVRPQKVYNVYSNFHAAHALSVGCWFLCDVVGGVLQAGDDADAAVWVTYEEGPSLAFPTDRLIIDELAADGSLRRK